MISNGPEMLTVMKSIREGPREVPPWDLVKTKVLSQINKIMEKHYSRADQLKSRALIEDIATSYN